jgi:hypothetical protein
MPRYSQFSMATPAKSQLFRKIEKISDMLYKVGASFTHVWFRKTARQTDKSKTLPISQKRPQKIINVHQTN